MSWFGDGSSEADRFPRRGDSMCLSTVDKPDPYRKARPRRPEDVIGLKTEDIAGAQTGTTPRARRQRYTQKVHYGVDVSDIEGAQAPHLIPEVIDPVRRPNNRILSNSDIEYSQPRPKTFKTTRSTNPLCPDYRISDAEDRPVTPPKFIRDSFNVSDIEGTKAKPLYRRQHERDPLAVSDIPGTTVGWKPEFKRRTSPSKALDTTDINNDGIFRTRRVTNPLEPCYQYDVPEELAQCDPSARETWTIGDIPGSHPKGPPASKPRIPFSLRTDDIPEMREREGHNLPRTFPREANRRDFRKINNLDDIEGARPSNKRATFVHETGRITNPLCPSYVDLDGPAQPEFPASVSASSVGTPLLSLRSNSRRSAHSVSKSSVDERVPRSSASVVGSSSSQLVSIPTSAAARPPSSAGSVHSVASSMGSRMSALSSARPEASSKYSTTSSVASTSLSSSRPKNFPSVASSSSSAQRRPPPLWQTKSQRDEDIESVRSLPK